MSPQEDQMYIENKQIINPVRMFSLLYSPAVGLQRGGGRFVVPKNRKNSAAHKLVGRLPNENEDDNILNIIYEPHDQLSPPPATVLYCGIFYFVYGPITPLFNNECKMMMSIK